MSYHEGGLNAKLLTSSERERHALWSTLPCLLVTVVGDMTMVILLALLDHGKVCILGLVAYLHIAIV